MAVDDIEMPTTPPSADEFSSANRAPAADTGPPDPVGDLMWSPPPGMTDIQRRKGEETSRVLTTAERRAEQDRGYMKQRFDAMGVETEKLRPWDHEKEQQKYQTNPIEAFGSFASLFGLVASAFTRAPMENALNASAAAMNAIKEGDDRQYEKAHAAWKENMTLVEKRHNMMQTEFNDATTLMKTDLALGEAKAKNIATRFGDEQSLLLLEHGMSKEWFELMDSRNKSIKGAQEAADSVDKRRMHDYFFKTMMDRAKETGADKDPSTVLRIWQKANGIKPGSPEEEIMFQYLSTPDADGKLPSPEKAGKFYHDLKQQARYDSSDSVGAREIERRTKQYVGEGMKENEAYDKASQEVQEAKVPESKLTPAQGFIRKWKRENPDGTSEDMTKAVGEFVQGQKNLNADQEFIKRFYQEKPEAKIEEFSKAFDEFKKGQKGATGAAGGNTNLTNDRQIAADVAAYREKLKTSIDPETGENYTSDKIGDLASRRYAQLKSTSTPITANKRDELRGMADRAQNFLDTIDKVEDILARHNMTTGIGGMVTRPAEAFGNILQVSNETDRKQMQRWISELKEWAPRILNESRGRPLASEAAQVNNIVAGLNFQDTTANVVRGYRELKPLIQKIQNDLHKRAEGEYQAPKGVGGPGSGGSTGGKSKWQDAPIIQPAPGKRSSNMSDMEFGAMETVDVPPGANLEDYIPRRGAG